MKALRAATDSQISVYLNNQLKNKKQAHQQNAALALCSGLLAVISQNQSMRIIIILFSCVLFSNCNWKSDKLNTFNDLKNTVWIDSLCNEFRFKDSTFVKKRLFEKVSNLDEVGKLKLTNEIELQFINDFDEIEKYYLKSNLNGELVFKPVVSEFSNDIILFKKKLINKPELEIHEITYYVKFSSNLAEFTISDDKTIKYRRAKNYNELQTLTFSDSTFNQIKQYLEILKFDKYEDIYEYPGFDGADYELNIKTNRYTKTIKCTQRLTEGIWNFISYIDYKLQTE
ncbi:hypothetical protein MED134_03214 [Dokdonia sp. MED134]|uniref:hypothetical protein n=1 Tax=Dokdonia sp. MED134 TaxID=313590 RepID=UPI0000689C07|nr:hypothetical protein [Dokdonia sp. MED134]EAQ38288.1 hypothetical protein MED134_03214 [Dokdonia sp. MED134]